MTVKQRLEIKNRLGMHARPAMKLHDLVQQFQSQVTLRNSNNVQAEAHSVIAMLMLDSEQGSYIEVEATGSDEQQALSAIIELFNSGFGEG
ncbi:MAG: PTS phosphocarrier protein NPr [Enterobacteriaceae bacterium]|jgi:phosphocarrier protein NPr|nr:PTS phosphocarrier protein NPr [Enterobacteriaceae bacterium]